MQLKTKQAFHVVFLVLLVSGFLEIALGLLTFVSPRVKWLLGPTGIPWISYTIPDERLRHRPNPAYPGHDSKGFRNSGSPTNVQIVALGDSQTYGVGVAAKDAWPRRLESMIGKKVYSMAYGGYGPTHSLILWDEAVALQPDVVIEAFYAGNDLFDSFDHVYNWRQLSELRSSDPTMQASIIEAEQSKPIRKRVINLFYMNITRDGISPRRFLSQYSKIYGLLRRTKYELLQLIKKFNKDTLETWEREKARAEARPAFLQIFDDGQFQTIFTSEYRLSALNLEDPRIAEGHKISLRAIKRMHQLAAESNIRFLVVLVPTKEMVFSELWQHPSLSYRSLIENEERLLRETKKFFTQNGIEYLDSLPVLRKQLALGIQPYPKSRDGHPNEHGHIAIANLLASHLQSP
ncbi:MAG: SGNH/GDSL hydrolase family protein [Planctomycetota bacterium]|jgi:hypothetical protein